MFFGKNTAGTITISCRIFVKWNFLQDVADIGGDWLHIQLPRMTLVKKQF